MRETNRMLPRFDAAVAVAALLLAAGGCASVDPRPDVARAAEIVAARTGHRPGWDPKEAPAAAILAGRRSLTASEAVRIALSNNPALQAGLADIAAARAELVEAGLPSNPMINFMALFEGGEAAMISAAVLQSLSDLWLIPSRREAARAALQETVLRVSDQALSLASSVERRHRRVVYYQEVVKFLDDQSETLRLAIEAARKRLEAGIGTVLDVNRLSAEFLRNAVSRRAAVSSLEVEKRLLLEEMGIAGASTDFVAEAWGASGEDAVPSGEDAAIQLARAGRLDLLAAGWTVEAKARGLGAARLGRLPETRIGVGYEREKAGGMTTDMVGPALMAAPPIFNWNQGRIALAEASLEKARSLAAALEQKAIREVRQAWQEFETARRQLETCEQELIPLTDLALAQVRSAFEAGEADLVDILMAERDRIEVLLTGADLRLREDIARIDLLLACGGRFAVNAEK